MPPSLSLKLRIAGGFIVFVAGGAGVFSPFVFRRTHEAHVSAPLLLLKAFSAGVVLSLALVHLVGDSFNVFLALPPGATPLCRSRRRCRCRTPYYGLTAHARGADTLYNGYTGAIPGVFVVTGICARAVGEFAFAMSTLTRRRRCPHRRYVSHGAAQLGRHGRCRGAVL
jgi:hypothetical protein